MSAPDEHPALREMREYLENGGTNERYVLEWLERLVTPQVQEVVALLWRNLEEQ
ncbi:MAG: hypothetical protein ACRCZP_17435 [Phycicoccus sp.]